MLYSQPLATRFGLDLIRYLAAPGWESLDIAVAWILSTGLAHVRPSLEAFVRGWSRLRVFVGIDLDNTTKEGLESLLSLKGLEGSNSSFITTSPQGYFIRSSISLLYAHQVAPIGGFTEFADMRAAWDALPEAKRRKLEGLKVFHSVFHSRAKLGMTDYTERERASLPGAEQVLVRTIPQTGRKALYLASHAVRIVGMPDAESEALLAELMEFATERRFVYSHRWRVHDLVMWDNRCTMHRGTEYDERRWKRDMHRATVSDIGNTLEAS